MRNWQFGLFAGIFISAFFLVVQRSVSEELPATRPMNAEEKATAQFADSATAAERTYGVAFKKALDDYRQILVEAKTKPTSLDEASEVEDELKRLDAAGKSNLTNAFDTTDKPKSATVRRGRGAFDRARASAATSRDKSISKASRDYATALFEASNAAWKDPHLIQIGTNVSEAKRLKKLSDDVKAGKNTGVAVFGNVDLLKTVQLPADKISGDWTVDKTTGAFTAPAAKPARLQFHADPPGEYDYAISFNRQAVPDDQGTSIDILAEYKHRHFSFNICFQFAKNNKAQVLVGVSDIKQKDLVSNRTQRWWYNFPPSGTDVTVVLCVRDRSVAAYLESEGGKRSQIGHWAIDYADVSMRDERGVPSGIGVSVNSNGVIVSAAKLTDIVQPHGRQVETVAADGMRHIDLLAGISVDDDKVTGDWKMSPTGLECPLPGGSDSRIAFCKAPTCPYSYKISYQTSDGDAGVGQVLVDAPNSFVWFTGVKNTGFGFYQFAGSADHSWSAPDALLLENGKPHTSEVSVGPDRVSAIYDGVKVRELTTSGSDLSTRSGWDIGPELIGITTHRATIITSAELIVPLNGPKAADLFPFAASGNDPINATKPVDNAKNQPAVRSVPGVGVNEPFKFDGVWQSGKATATVNGDTISKEGDHGKITYAGDKIFIRWDSGNQVTLTIDRSNPNELKSLRNNGGVAAVWTRKIE